MCGIDANKAMEEVKSHAKDVVKEHPSLLDEVNGFLELCHTEIEMGESPYNEIEMCWGEIDYLVEHIDDED